MIRNLGPDDTQKIHLIYTRIPRTAAEADFSGFKRNNATEKPELQPPNWSSFNYPLSQSLHHLETPKGQPFEWQSGNDRVRRVPERKEEPFRENYIHLTREVNVRNKSKEDKKGKRRRSRSIPRPTASGAPLSPLARQIDIASKHVAKDNHFRRPNPNVPIGLADLLGKLDEEDNLSIIPQPSYVSSSRKSSGMANKEVQTTPVYMESESELSEKFPGFGTISELDKNDQVYKEFFFYEMLSRYCFLLYLTHYILTKAIAGQRSQDCGKSDIGSVS